MKMDKRTMWLWRGISLFCILMAIGAYQTSVLSCILMLVVGVCCLPGTQFILSRHMSTKFRIIVLVVLTVLALTISNAELQVQAEAEAGAGASSVSDPAEESA